MMDHNSTLRLPKGFLLANYSDTWQEASCKKGDRLGFCYEYLLLQLWCNGPHFFPSPPLSPDAGLRQSTSNLFLWRGLQCEASLVCGHPKCFADGRDGNLLYDSPNIATK